MKYLSQNISNKKISRIGLGTGRFGTRIPETLAYDLLDIFVQYGGTVIDTARNYYEWVEDGRGKSELCIGHWLESRNIRDEVCIVTKGGVKNKGNIWNINLSRNNLQKELEQSLEALRTDYVDIYLLHRDEPNRPVEEIIETMQYLAEFANIKKIGVANWNIDRIIRINQYAKQYGLKMIEVVQNWWSIAEYKYEMWDDENTTHMDNETHQYLLDNGFLGMAYTSQCKGYFQKASKLGYDKVDEFLRHRIETPQNIKILNYLNDYAQTHHVTITDLVNSYITSDIVNSIALVSCNCKEQLEDIVQHCDYEMPLEIIQFIQTIKGQY